MAELKEEDQMNNDRSVTRRQFLEGTIAAAASLAMAGPALGAEGKPAPPAPADVKRKIKVGVIGGGGRGNFIGGFMKQHGGYEMHAVADYFPDLAESLGENLGVDKSRRFTGLSSCKRMLDSGVEALAIIDVPYFYPEQAKAAVEAGCHVYMAKPVAVDVPGCLTIEAAARKATEKKRVFLVDYQIPHDPANIEVADRVRAGGVGPVAHIVSFGCPGAWPDPPKGATIEDRLRGAVWLSDIALGGDTIVSHDIHIIDGVTWITGKRAASASGRSRILRPEPHGDRTDACDVVFEYDDGVLWTHVTHSLDNNTDTGSLQASILGLSATAHFGYTTKAYVRGGDKHYSGEVSGAIYNEGAERNVADFYRNIVEGHFENPTAKRAVDGTLTAILGREAAARGCYLTMEQLLRENKRLEVDLRGLKA